MYTIYDLPPVITWTSAAVSAAVCVTAYVWGETTAPFLEVERRRAIPQPPGSSCHRSDHLVIFLHGIGASGGQLMPLAKSWRVSLPKTRIAAPDAPLHHWRGHQWF